MAIKHYTNLVEAQAIQDLGAKTVAKFVIEQIIYKLGCHQLLLIDNGKLFIRCVLLILKYLIRIRGLLTTSYHLESKGTVEIVNGTLERFYKKQVATKPQAEISSYNWLFLHITSGFTHLLDFDQFSFN